MNRFASEKQEENKLSGRWFSVEKMFIYQKNSEFRPNLDKFTLVATRRSKNLLLNQNQIKKLVAQQPDITFLR